MVTNLTEGNVVTDMLHAFYNIISLCKYKLGMQQTNELYKSLQQTSQHRYSQKPCLPDKKGDKSNSHCIICII
jgi:hypothetical protein